MTLLHNKKNKEQLIEELRDEPFERITLSFYKYTRLDNLIELRSQFYIQWTELKILGRIYIAEEGINAQISIPKNNLSNFKKSLNQYKQLKNILFKKAVEESESFYKLIIKVKKEIVAYGLSKNAYNMKKTGKHLSQSK